MTRASVVAFSVCVVLGVGLPTAAKEAPPAPSPLWGDLRPGPHAVGYQVLYRFDTSRAWATTRPYGKGFTADTQGRPMRISVWYPAARSLGHPLRFEDYFRGGSGSAPKSFANIEALLAERDGGVYRQSQAESYPALAATPVNASANAPVAAGRFPLVLTTGGQGAMLTTNATLAEYLASHGYVVATVLTLGPSSDEPILGLTPAEVDITVRDFEFATSVVSALPNVDPTRLAMVGHSMGGSAAVLFAMQNPNVSAVVGLDGTYGFPHPPADPGILSVTQGYRHAPRRMQAALLDLRRQQPWIDLSAVRSYRHSDRYLVTLTQMFHSSFINGNLHQRFTKEFPTNPGGTTPTSSGEGFTWSCRLIEAFLDLQLKADATGLTRMNEFVAHNPRATLAHEPALPARPPPTVVLDQAEARGFDATITTLEQLEREIPEEPLVDESVFVAMGYELLGQGKSERAVLAFRLAEHFHPASANAADSLGDGYLAAGQKEAARQAFARALEKAPKDPALNPESRDNLLTESTRKMKALAP
ncbi:dienelactone hydrolase family protein [Corallococcus sp. M34]|uniref:poly(ethylene terephthalate) hydrolase family protein n=1 Tax=Citreicoccus inhibens TaxID=2849499 RepID=UPI001C233992|nr:dienelactone hydrolase family protein [Citreicoccus inhibens]MBU8899589.1 dienelactone hydrolase family protein [Citreicoccus inhibens]